MNLQQALAIRSQLFIPALSTQFVEKAHTRGADAIIIDLEDAITPQAKGEARRALAEVTRRIAAHSVPVFVRVNNSAALLAEDLEAALATPAVGIFLPKAEDPAQAGAVAQRLQGTNKCLALLLESPMAVLHAAELAACSDRIVALVFGSEDYSTCMGVRPTIEAMRAPAHAVALAARAWGRAAWGVVGSIAEIGDLEHFSRMAAVARDTGYTGALAIHPRQVAVLNEAFGASSEELLEAAAIVDAFEKATAIGQGAVQHKGRMLDKPIVDRARALILKQAQRVTPQLPQVESRNRTSDTVIENLRLFVGARKNVVDEPAISLVRVHCELHLLVGHDVCVELGRIVDEPDLIYRAPASKN